MGHFYVQCGLGRPQHLPRSAVFSPVSPGPNPGLYLVGCACNTSNGQYLHRLHNFLFFQDSPSQTTLWKSFSVLDNITHVIPIGEHTIWSWQSSSVVIETAWEFIGCRGGGSKSVNHGYSDAGCLLLGKEEQSLCRSPSLCVTNREIRAVCPSLRARGKTVTKFTAQIRLSISRSIYPSLMNKTLTYLNSTSPVFGRENGGLLNGESYNLPGTKYFLLHNNRNNATQVWHSIWEHFWFFSSSWIQAI